MRAIIRTIHLARAAGILSLFLFTPSGVPGQPFSPPVQVKVKETLDSLLSDEDTDHDAKITVGDPRVPGTSRGDKRFWLTTTRAARYEIAGTYYLSNLLQELELARQGGLQLCDLSPLRIFEPPSERISRLIRETYWDGLTRRVDRKGLEKILTDEKSVSADGFRYVYVPPSDRLAVGYFTSIAPRGPEWKVKVVQLPDRITPEYVHGLDARPGILSLKIDSSAGLEPEGAPFVVPGGRFNEMYGWDSYFIALGLLRDGKVDLARSMVDNLVYEIEHYGAILNANRTYYLTRSQPPFLTSMALEVYSRLKKGPEANEWLRGAMGAAIREYTSVWMNPGHLTKIGLSRYFDYGTGPPPEVEPGHFDGVFAAFARKFKMDARKFEAAYRAGTMKVPELDAYFVQDRSMRESGHDTSYRLEGRSADLATVDLNSLLYKIETDIARTIETEFSGSMAGPEGRTEKSPTWYARALKRKKLINDYLWDQPRGMFFDYDVRRGERTGYVSATTFYPLWAGLASKEQADMLIKNALPLLEMAGGIAGSSEKSRGPITPEHPLRQWDYPFGWAPHQMLLWRAMANAGKDSIGERLAYRWLYTITVNAADYNGTVPEKFDVVDRTHQVFAEYGNVGTKFAYITREGFGWTNASYQIGLEVLPQALRDSLDKLIPPEWIFGPSAGN
jgi:alpha,alpha-trehalase